MRETHSDGPAGTGGGARREERVPVLVVGAGYAGLSAAALLAWRGVPVTLVERHASTSVQPKAFGVSWRALELLRSVPGIEESLGEIWEGIGDGMRIAIASSLSDPEPNMIVDGRRDDFGFMAEITPVPDVGAPQSRVERLLRDKAAELGADLRFSTELVSPGTGHRWRDRAGRRSRDRRGDERARRLPGRRRRPPQPRPRPPGHPHRRQGRSGPRLPDHVRRRPRRPGRRPRGHPLVPAERDLHRRDHHRNRGGIARAERELRPRRGGERGRLHRGALPRPRPGRHRRARARRAPARPDELRDGPHPRRPLPAGPGVPRRRRGAHDAADRRPGRQHRPPGRLRHRLAALAGDLRAGR